MQSMLHLLLFSNFVKLILSDKNETFSLETSIFVPFKKPYLRQFCIYVAVENFQSKKVSKIDPDWKNMAAIMDVNPEPRQ